jgi:hypothetical protein
MLWIKLPCGDYLNLTRVTRVMFREKQDSLEAFIETTRPTRYATYDDEGFPDRETDYFGADARHLQDLLTRRAKDNGWHRHPWVELPGGDLLDLGELSGIRVQRKEGSPCRVWLGKKGVREVDPRPDGFPARPWDYEGEDAEKVLEYLHLLQGHRLCGWQPPSGAVFPAPV